MDTLLEILQILTPLAVVLVGWLLQRVHKLVNSRLTAALEEIGNLREELGRALMASEKGARRGKR